MNYAAHGLTLAFAWFLAVNAAASLASAAIAGRVRRSSPLLLTVRLFPAALSAAFVAGLFVPSYLRFEPREVVEGFDVTLTALAIAAAALLTSACLQGAAAWWRASRRARRWIDAAKPFALPSVRVPAFRVDAPEPLMALVGIARPRLIVTQGLLNALTPEELTASVAHELGHHRALDNLKRLAMRAAPDLLRGTSAARTLERRWAGAAEHDADHASSSHRASRLALASALVKVARLTPPRTPIAEPISTLVGGGEIASRVERLIDDPPAAADRRRTPARWLVGIAAAALVLAATYAPLLAAVHRATEILVQQLP